VSTWMLAAALFVLTAAPGAVLFALGERRRRREWRDARRRALAHLEHVANVTDPDRGRYR
jgi:hypothetical protein